MFCRECGEDIGDAEICPNCGTPQINEKENIGDTLTENYKEPFKLKSGKLNIIIAFLLNLILFIFPGIGQIYLGLTKKGMIILTIFWIYNIIEYLTKPTILHTIIWLYALIDVIISGQRIMKGEYVEDSLFGFSF